jgi:putative transposase
MTVSRPGALRAGDEVRVAGQAFRVVAVSGTQVEMADVTGASSVRPLSALLSDPTFVLVSVPRAPLPPEGLLDVLAPEVVEQARWWERHVLEVLTGRAPDAEPGAAGRSEYDPGTRSLRQRELAKVAELAAEGNQVSLATMQRQRLAYERAGVAGLIDRRTTRPVSSTGRAGPRLVAAVRQAIGEETERSTGTVARLRRRVEQILAEQYEPGEVVLPARRTFYRLVNGLAAGKHTFGSARTRRSLAKQPEGPFGAAVAARPGELMQIDSTPLDVRAVLNDGLVDRVELTALVDQATRTIAAAVLRPSTKAVDAALLLARAVTPEPLRPGWSDALRMTRSVLPHRNLIDIDARLEHAAAKPVIMPETIVCDHGKAYLSQAFRSGCRALGINLQPAHPDTPTDKPVVERTLESVGTLFAQHVAGYVGSSVERRGANADTHAVWSILELQDLLDEWIVSTWQNRPHDGLRDPLMPGTAPTPNEKYAALVTVAGYVPVPLTPTDYIELLPVTWRAINTYGIKLRRRTYDAQALNLYRRQPSGIAARKGLWEVHHDPYDVSQIWIRNHHDGGWITATWTHLRHAPVPFGDLAWDHARQILAQRGTDPATEAEIATAAAALLDRAEQGPPRATPATKRSRRVAGRTKATNTPAWPRPDTDEHAEPCDDADADAGDETPIAKVIPLGVFDPFEEATKRW